MFNRPRYFAVGIVVLAALVLINLPKGTTARLKLVSGGVFLPLFGLANSAHGLSQKAQSALEPRPLLLQKLEQLSKENSELRLRVREGEAARRENNHWRELLGAPKPMPSKWKFARIVGRDPANWWRSIQIDLGSRDGARPNLTVLTPDGLVGRIAEVGLHRSLVLLVGDPNCKVAASVLKSGGSVETYGFLIADTGDPLDNSLADLTYVPRKSTLEPGQAVVTSGEGGIFPKGIPIGKIVDTRRVELGLYLEARVKLAVNFNRLEEVWVILP